MSPKEQLVALQAASEGELSWFVNGLPREPAPYFGALVGAGARRH